MGWCKVKGEEKEFFMKKLLLLLSLFLISFKSEAVNITISSTCNGGANTANCQALEDELNSYLNSETPDVSIDKYADGISNATGFAMKGQNSEYAENFSLFVFKPSFGLAAQGDVDEPESAEGFGLGGALTVGINLDLLPIDKIGPIEFKKMDLFVSFMSYNLDQEVGDNATGEGELSSFSVMARYRLMDAVDIVPGYMLQWGGLHIHTGIQRNKMGIELSQDLEDETVTDEGTGASGTFNNGNVTFDMDSTVTSIPFEISTSIRALYVLSLYGGLGFDYNLTSETDVDLNADGTFNGNAGGDTYVANISADESASGEGMATNYRGFVGLQFNVPFVRIYVQANKSFAEELVGVNAGLKITY
tara:strand:- start:88525 stop:89610 length:1086 start_codon:yes stop_codon:yes gene_type:complete